MKRILTIFWALLLTTVLLFGSTLLISYGWLDNGVSVTSSTGRVVNVVRSGAQTSATTIFTVNALSSFSGTGAGVVKIGQLSNATTFGALGFNATLDSPNFALAGDGSTVIVNGATMLNLQRGNITVATVNTGLFQVAATSALQQLPRTTDPGCTVVGDIGKFWFDNTTTTTVASKCVNVAGTVGWVAF